MDLIKKLQKRIIDISFKLNLGHLGSCLSTLPILLEIYENKNKEDIFILSNGHAGLALYVILEYFEGKNAEELFEKFGVHPKYSPKDGIFCSGGSLGQGITIGAGYAIGYPNKKIYILISDGESAEGSVWETLKFFKEKNIKNIEIYANLNGYSAINKVNTDYLSQCLKTFYPNIKLRYTSVEVFDFLKGLEAHYKVMNEEEYKHAINQLK
jgi:transketolase